MRKCQRTTCLLCGGNIAEIGEEILDLATSVFVHECQQCHGVCRSMARLPKHIRTGVCTNRGLKQPYIAYLEGKAICNIGFACDGCPYNPDNKAKELFIFR